jgi:predicted dehydrogenase
MGDILTFKVGFIGAGSIARHHISAAQAVGFIPTSICGRNFSVKANKLSSEFEGLDYYPNLDSFLESDFDCVCILLNTDVSLEIYKKVISKRNIPVLIEKPVTQSSDALNDNLDLDRNNTIVGYNRRFYSSVIQLQTYLQENQNIQSHWNIPEISWQKEPTNSEKKHFLLENSVHILDLFLYLLGMPVESEFYNLNSEGFLKYSSSVHRFNDDNIATLTVNFGTPDNTSAAFYSPGNYYLLKPIEIISKYSKIITEPASANFPYKKYMPKEETEWEISQNDLNFKPGFYSQYIEFMNICKGSPRKDGASLRDAYNVLKFAEKIIRPLDN